LIAENVLERDHFESDLGEDGFAALRGDYALRLRRRTRPGRQWDRAIEGHHPTPAGL
jgi:hypothetical protein